MNEKKNDQDTNKATKVGFSAPKCYLGTFAPIAKILHVFFDYPKQKNDKLLSLVEWSSFVRQVNIDRIHVEHSCHYYTLSSFLVYACADESEIWDRCT